MDAALTRSQVIRMVLFGLAVWFIGAIMVRFARQFDLLGR
jgi:type IV secretory pathway TrbD component